MSYRGLRINGNLTWHEFQDLRGLLQHVGGHTWAGSQAMTLLRRARAFLVAQYWAVLYLTRLHNGGVSGTYRGQVSLRDSLRKTISHWITTYLHLLVASQPRRGTVSDCRCQPRFLRYRKALREGSPRYLLPTRVSSFSRNSPALNGASFTVSGGLLFGHHIGIQVYPASCLETDWKKCPSVPDLVSPRVTTSLQRLFQSLNHPQWISPAPANSRT